MEIVSSFAFVLCQLISAETFNTRYVVCNEFNIASSHRHFNESIVVVYKQTKNDHG